MSRRRTFGSNVAAIAWKEAAVLRHDKAFLITVAVQPVMMFAIFCLALSYEPANVPWVVHDQDRSAASRRLVAAIEASGYFLAPEAVESYAEARERLRRGEAMAALVVPSTLSRDLERGAPGVQLLLDGGDPLTAARVGGIVTAIARETELTRAPGPERRPLEIRGLVRFNPTLDDRLFLASVFAGMFLTNLCISVTSLSLVAERERGTYEQTLALPTRTVEIVLGKLVPYVAVAYVMVGLSVLASGLVLDFWPRGSLLALTVVTLPYVLATLALGALVSAFSRTSAQAVFLAVFAILPSFVLSGAMLPYRLMPDGIRELGFVLPLRWYQIALRRILMRGADLADVIVPTLALFAIFGVLLALLGWRMKPRLA